MARAKRKVGGQPGNNNRVNGMRWKAALERALEIRADKMRGRVDAQEALAYAALGLVDAAIDGDVGAAKELGDRFDGKVADKVQVEAGKKTRRLLIGK